MKRAIFVILTVLFLVAGLAGMGLGAYTLWAFGSNGRITAQVAPAQTDAAAVYVSTFNVNHDPIPDNLLDLYVVAESSNGKDVFVGFGPPGDVQTYLVGVPYEAVSSIENNTLVTNNVPGPRDQATPPAEQTFWTTQGQGNSARAAITQSDQPQVLVVMNADGTPQIDAQLSVEMGSDNVRNASFIALGIGIVLFLLGILWWTLARRARTKSVPGA